MLVNSVFNINSYVLDTEKVHKITFSRIAKEYGKIITDELRMKILGRQEIDSASLIVDTLQLDISPKVFLEKAHAIEVHEMKNVRLMHGEYIFYTILYNISCGQIIICFRLNH